MASLSAEHQEVLQLRNWQKCSFVEIGQHMNRSEEAARKLWARAVFQLKLAMQVRDSKE
jgi:DNA-directed RNA polymerase specialized sigma24 family protein